MGGRINGGSNDVPTVVTGQTKVTTPDPGVGSTSWATYDKDAMRRGATIRVIVLGIRNSEAMKLNLS